MSNGTRQFRAHRRAGAVTFRTPADAGSAGAGRPCNRQGLSGHRPQHQEGRPSTSPAPARPAAPHLDAKNTPRSLSGCFRSGNSGSSGNGSPHECVIVRKRSTPSGTATGTTAKAAGTAAPGGRPSTLTSSAPARPAGPVAPPQPGRRTQRTARHDRRPCGPLLALGAGLPSIPGQKQESRHGAGSGGGKGPQPRESGQQRRPDRVAPRHATAREAPVARQAARLMDKVPGIPQRRSHGNRVPALADD